MLTQVYLGTRFHPIGNKHKIGSFAAFFMERAVELHKIAKAYKNTSSTRLMMNAIIESIQFIHQNNLQGNFIIYCNHEDLVININDMIFRGKYIPSENIDLWNSLFIIFDERRMVMKYREDLDNICLIKLTMLCDITLNKAEDKEIEYQKDIGVKP